MKLIIFICMTATALSASAAQLLGSFYGIDQATCEKVHADYNEKFSNFFKGQRVPEANYSLGQNWQGERHSGGASSGMSSTDPSQCTLIFKVNDPKWDVAWKGSDSFSGPGMSQKCQDTWNTIDAQPTTFYSVSQVQGTFSKQCRVVYIVPVKKD